MKYIVVFSLLVVSVRSNSKLPHSFKKCNRKQPDLNKCLREAAGFNVHLLVHPFRDLKLPTLRPLSIPSLYIGSGKSAVSVEQYFTNCHVHGLDHTEFKQFEFNFDAKRLQVDTFGEEVTKKCNYKLNGKVLLLPIRGEGDSTIVLKDLKVAGYFDFEEMKRSNHTYLKFNSHNLTLEVSHAYFHFDNLFDGDRALGDSINKVLNDNWKQVYEDVRDGYTQALGEIVMSLLNGFWSGISLEQALDGET